MKKPLFFLELVTLYFLGIGFISILFFKTRTHTQTFFITPFFCETNVHADLFEQ